jgi:hypothetical protein
MTSKLGKKEIVLGFPQDMHDTFQIEVFKVIIKEICYTLIVTKSVVPIDECQTHGEIVANIVSQQLCSPFHNEEAQSHRQLKERQIAQLFWSTIETLMVQVTCKRTIYVYVDFYNLYAYTRSYDGTCILMIV